jgi:hypothetical protein
MTDYIRDLRLAKWVSGVSLLGSNPEPPMSALGQKRTFRRSVDHLIGAAEQGLGHRQAERLCCLQVNGEFVFVWGLHRQISRFLDRKMRST